MTNKDTQEDQVALVPVTVMVVLHALDTANHRCFVPLWSIYPSSFATHLELAH